MLRAAATVLTAAACAIVPAACGPADRGGPTTATSPTASPTTASGATRAPGVASTATTRAPRAASTTAAPAATGLADSNTSSPPTTALLVADHTTTDPSLIPAEWVARARRSVVWAYGSTSHGTQLWAGALNLADHDDRFPFGAEWRSVPTEPGLRMGYDDGWTWDAAGFADRARSLLADVPGATAFMWSWCGEVSDPGTDIDAYLDAMTRLRQEYPEVVFVYMTGHTDGGNPDLAAGNDRIRRHVSEHGAVLFDFADIERYDPAGTGYEGADDSCRWCDGWCRDHPDDCAGLEGFECAHSHPLTCRLKAGALWWLSARLAGWDGT